MRALAAVLTLITPAAVWAQDLPAREVVWHPLGARSVDLQLAGPAGGPVLDAFFSQDGARLFVRTGRGHYWFTEDLGATWQRAAEVPAMAHPRQGVENIPKPPGEPSAAIHRHPFDSRVLYALGEHLYRSVDGGQTWVNLTADALGSIIGPDQHAIAFSPDNPDLVVVANSFGLWRSADGGLSWTSLNPTLPNLPELRIRRLGESGPRVWLRGLGSAETGPSGLWRTVADEATASWFRAISALPAGDQRRIGPSPLELPAGWVASYRLWSQGRPASPDLTACAQSPCQSPDRHYISAFAGAGDPQPRFYVGTSDGLLWTSPDGGRTWQPPQHVLPVNGNPVTSLWVDPRNPFVALAAFGGRGSGHVFRTTNGGLFWDDLTAGLPDAPVHALAANSETGSVYVASEAGVFYTRSDLRSPGPPTRWVSLSGNLPNAPVEDLRLDPASGSLTVAVAGYGLYRTTLPDVADTLRVLNAADLSARAAAPGGLLTVLGAWVRAARTERLSAPVLAAGRDESQIQVPFEATGPTLNLALETQRGVRRIGVPLEAVSPAIFVDADGLPLILDAGTGSLLDPGRPARAGSQILILATGLGRVRPEWPTGMAAPLDDPPVTIVPVAAYLNGAPLRVLSSTLAPGYIGVYMVRAELPAILNSGSGELVLAAGDKTSNRVRIYLDPRP